MHGGKGERMEMRNKTIKKKSGIRSVKKRNSENVRRTHKDRLFVKLFGDPENKQSLMSLYNALNGRDCTDVNELEINTIEDVIYMGRKNDISCIVDAHMNLFEHQSTYNPNMPLRGMIYIAKLYEKYIEQHGLNIFSENLTKIPTPRYFVLYNGEKDMPERMELKLSDAFMHPEEDTGIEFTAIMLNVNYGHSTELMSACRTLEEYAIFVDKVRAYAKQCNDSDNLKQAIDRAVDECIKEGVLAGFLSAHKAEVIGMILTEYDEEKTMEMLKKEFRQDGWNEGHSVGKQEEKYMIAARMKSMGFPEDQIAEILNVTLEGLKEILNAGKANEDIAEYRADK